MSIEGLKMCKIQSLRLSVNEQLTLVGDEIWSVMEKHQQHPGGGGGGPSGGGQQGPPGPGGGGGGVCGPPGQDEAEVSVRLFVSERLSAAAEIIVALVQREMDVYEAQLLDIVVKPHNKMHRPDLQFQLPPYGGSDQSQSLPLHQNHSGTATPGGDALSSSCSVGQSNDSDGQGGGAQTKRTYKRTRGRGQRPNHSCLLCKKAFRHKTNLVKHAADTHMDNAGCVCGVCGDTPDGREALVEHMESHRADGSGAGGTCSICGKSFQNMETHMRRHTGVKPYSCPVCYKRFPRPGALRRHKKIHARDPRVCYVCGEMFRGEEELQAHIKDTHKGEDHCEDDDDEEEEGGGWKEGGDAPSDRDAEPGIGNYYCRVCGDTFYSKGFLRKHALSHCKEAQCACGVCGEWFESGEGLTTHLRSHREPSGPCKICGKVFQNMETHMRRHTGEKPYSCSICHKRFPRPGALRRHKKTHVAEREQRAAHASTSQAKTYGKAGGLKPHLGGGGGGHPSWGGVDRDDLDKDGDSVLKMLEQAEMDKDGGGGAPDPDDLDLLCPPHRCMVCGDNFQSKGHLRKHAERHFNDPESRCGVCGERVPAHESLTEHLRSHIETGGKICHVCGKTYQNIETHMRIHTGVKPYTCPVCNKSFPRPGALRRHRKLHTGERPYICEFCGKAFIDNGALSTHIKSHTDDKLNARVSCDICGKSLASQHVLEVHKRIHTGEKPFECHVCGKAFRQVGGLNAHMLTHTGEKPFSCGICSKSFSTKGYLETHVRFHKKDKPFGCHLCWKAFVTKNDLKKHLLTHSGEKPYSCRVCGKSYQEKRSRDVHMKVHLGGGVKPGKDGVLGVGVGGGVGGSMGGLPDLRRLDGGGGVGGPMGGLPDLMRRHDGLQLHRDFIQL